MERSERWVAPDEHERDYIEQVPTATLGKTYGDDGTVAILGLPWVPSLYGRQFSSGSMLRRCARIAVTDLDSLTGL